MEVMCEICGAGPFKDARGLNGHKAIKHGVEKRIVIDSRAVELLKGYNSKVDLLLARQDQVISQMQQIAEQLGITAADDYTPPPLLEAVRTMIAEQLATTAADEGSPAETPSREKKDGHWGRRLESQDLEKEKETSKGGEDEGEKKEWRWGRG